MKIGVPNASVSAAPSRYRWTILAVNVFAQACATALLVGVPALAPAIRSAQGLTLAQTGVVLAASSAGLAAALVPWGILVDRLGERVVVTVGVGAQVVALLLAARTSSFAGLVVALGAAGALGASTLPSSGRAVMQWFGAGERGLALGIRQTAIPMGGAVAAATLPLAEAAGGIELAFGALAACAALAAVLAALLLRAGPASHDARPSQRHPLRDGSVWRISSSGALLMVGQQSVGAFVVIFLHSEHRLSPAEAGACLAAMHGLGAVARIAVGRWSDVVGRTLSPLRLLGLASTVGLVTVAATAAGPSHVAIAAVVVAGPIAMSWNGLMLAAAAEFAGARRSGSAVALQQTFVAASGAVTPLLMAPLFAATSWSAGFAVAALFPLAALAVIAGLAEP